MKNYRKFLARTSTYLIALPVVVLLVGGVVSWDILSAKAPRKSSTEKESAPLAVDAVSGPSEMPEFESEPTPRVERSIVSEEAAVEVPEPDEGQGVMTAEEIFVMLNNSFETDSRDSEAGLAIERAIEQAFRILETPGASLKEVECRRGSCRATVQFATAEADRDAFEEILADRDNPLGNFAFTIPRRETNADGTVLATLFVNLKS